MIFPLVSNANFRNRFLKPIVMRFKNQIQQLILIRGTVKRVYF